jgi:hypothetical protein
MSQPLENLRRQFLGNAFETTTHHFERMQNDMYTRHRLQWAAPELTQDR